MRCSTVRQREGRGPTDFELIHTGTTAESLRMTATSKSRVIAPHGAALNIGSEGILIVDSAKLLTHE